MEIVFKNISNQLASTLAEEWKSKQNLFFTNSLIILV
jgi:hypothetical protein